MADPPASRPPSHARDALIWVVKIAVSAGLLYWLSTKIDFSRLWQDARGASLAWLAVALVLYLVMIVISSWRWGLLLHAQHVRIGLGALTNSYLVATYYNNFLPSNIGGDVIRIRDTVRPTGSMTRATTIVLIDRGIGLLGLVFVAAMGATAAAWLSERIGPLGPGILWAGFVAGCAAAAAAVLLPHGIGWLLRPLRLVHQEWVGERIEQLTGALAKFGDAPRAIAGGFIGALGVQAVLIGFYAAIARSLHLSVPLTHLAIVVPLSFIVQMLPVSVNGLGVREWTWRTYLALLGDAAQGGVEIAFVGFIVIMVFSLSGAVAQFVRRHPATATVADQV